MARPPGAPPSNSSPASLRGGFRGCVAAAAAGQPSILYASSRWSPFPGVGNGVLQPCPSLAGRAFRPCCRPCGSRWATGRLAHVALCAFHHWASALLSGLPVRVLAIQGLQRRSILAAKGPLRSAFQRLPEGPEQPGEEGLALAVAVLRALQAVHAEGLVVRAGDRAVLRPCRARRQPAF